MALMYAKYIHNMQTNQKQVNTHIIFLHQSSFNDLKESVFKSHHSRLQQKRPADSFECWGVVSGKCWGLLQSGKNKTNTCFKTIRSTPWCELYLLLFWGMDLFVESSLNSSMRWWINQLINELSNWRIKQRNEESTTAMGWLIDWLSN